MKFAFWLSVLINIDKTKRVAFVKTYFKNLSFIVYSVMIGITVLNNPVSVFATPSIQMISSEYQVIIDENFQTKPLSIGIFHSDGGDVTLTCESDNLTLVSNTSFLINSAISHTVTKTLQPPPNHSQFLELQIIPVENQYGVAIITLTLEDINNQADSVSFELIVNGTPKISPIPDRIISDISQYHEIDFTIYDPETASENLDISIETSSTDILPLENVALTIVNQQARLIIKIIEGKNDMVSLTINVSDNRVITSHTFIIGIFSLPVIHVNDQWTVPLNTDHIAIPISICDSEGGNVTLTIQSSDTDFLANENIRIKGSQSSETNLNIGKEGCIQSEFYLVPQKNRVGDVDVILNADDGTYVGTQIIRLTLQDTQSENNRPIIKDHSVYMYENETYFHIIEGSHLNGVTYEISKEPGIGRVLYFNNHSGTFTYEPYENQSGQDVVEFIAYNDIQYSEPASLTIQVLPKNDLQYPLTVNIKGDYTCCDAYTYTFLDATNNEEILSGISDKSQFPVFLDEGYYRLTINSTSYVPYEYSQNNQYITIDEPSEITCYLTHDNHIKNDTPEVLINSLTNDDGGCFLQTTRVNIFKWVIELICCF